MSSDTALQPEEFVQRLQKPANNSCRNDDCPKKPCPDEDCPKKQPCPCVGFEFILPERSDDLYDALKEAYPDITEHDQRKLQALIDFLQRELRDLKQKEKKQKGKKQKEKKQPRSLSTNGSQNSSSPTGSADFHHGIRSRNGSQSSSASSCSSSDEDLVPDTRPADPFQSRPNQQQRASVVSPPTTGQEYIFNAADGQNVQPKTRKKMSAEEKAQYKETRRRGACERCKKTKGKCTHPKDPMYQVSEMLSPKQSSGKRKRSPLDQGHLGSNKTPKTEEETISLPATSMANVDGPGIPSDPSQGPQAGSDRYSRNGSGEQIKGSEIPSPPASLPSPPISCTSSDAAATPVTLPPTPPATTTSIVSIHTAQS